MPVTARAEHVGSLLRPRRLLDARAERAAGTLAAADFKAIEDAAVREAVTQQEEAGCPVVTDGELRRESFQSQLAEAVAGFRGVDINAWLWGDWHSDVMGDLHVERPPGVAVVEPLRRHRNLAAEEYTFLRATTDRLAKVTLPSPSLFASLWSPEESRDAYPTLDAFLADVVEILRAEVRELVRLGCRYIQLDAPQYPLLVDPGWRSFYASRGWQPEDWLSYGIELDNAVIDAGRPATFGFHLCRGNQRSRWLVSGGYDPIARKIFTGVRADRLLLEYDDERSGSFTPLRLVPTDKVVVLGLVTTKAPGLESEADLWARVREAGRLIDPECLAVGTQCGFATSVAGNAVGPREQASKLALLVRASERIFGAGAG